jgi:hypothetical protein
LHRRGVKIGKLEFAHDSLDCSLQAADMISWTARRTSSGDLPAGFEPLAETLKEHHFEVPYKEEWMRSVADKLREGDMDNSRRCAENLTKPALDSSGSHN